MDKVIIKRAAWRYKPACHSFTNRLDNTGRKVGWQLAKLSCCVKVFTPTKNEKKPPSGTYKQTGKEGAMKKLK